MADVEVSERKSISKIIIIALLVLILLLTAAIFVFVVTDNPVDGLVKIFQSNGEYTIPLDEFVVNLKQDSNIKHYIKIKIALMFTEENNSKVIETNVSKIRDTIISTLRSKTYEEVLNDEETINLKRELVENINNALNDHIVEGVYFTDVIVQ
jgi:flagellar FliL protein